ncbi:MAG: tRNA pseudouridine(55) synthase TruB [Candidatus Coproplasma sp.]
MNGIINVNKLQGVSSAREVAVIKRITGCSCGHMGTLDPMASGVLPIAVGNATRLFDYLLTKIKTYKATFRFGEDYDTLDVTGTLLKSGERVPTASEIESVLPSLTGEIMQLPPKYSAKNVNGKRGYQLARQGVEFELAPKKVRIDSITLLNQKGNDFSFEIVCGGGTYVRSIGRDMAAALGTCAAMSSLIRTASGQFKIENSVITEQLNSGNVESYLIPCDSIIDYPVVNLDEFQAKKLFNGIALKCRQDDGIYKIYAPNGSFYGLSEVVDGIMKVRTKLC